MKAMIFAAGLGTRLRPLTDTVPKAMVEVAGVPVLRRVMDSLFSAGISNFVVNVCHLKEQIRGYVSCLPQEYSVDISEEDGPEPLETGGGIRNAAPFLRGSGRFLVHNVDILSNLDVRSFISQDRPDSLATLLVEEAPSPCRLLFDDGMRLVGWTDIRTGEIKSPYHGLDPSMFKSLSFCGIHIVSEEVLSLMNGWPQRFSVIDFYLAQAASHPIYGVKAPEGFRMIDIGTPETLEEAGRLYSSSITAKTYSRKA